MYTNKYLLEVQRKVGQQVESQCLLPGAVLDGSHFCRVSTHETSYGRWAEISDSEDEEERTDDVKRAHPQLNWLCPLGEERQHLFVVVRTNTRLGLDYGDEIVVRRLKPDGTDDPQGEQFIICGQGKHMVWIGAEPMVQTFVKS